MIYPNSSQVHKNQSSRRGRGYNHSSNSSHLATTTLPPPAASRGSGRRDTVAPEPNERPVAWASQGEARGGHSGQGRGRKKRLAANFSTE